MSEKNWVFDLWHIDAAPVLKVQGRVHKLDRAFYDTMAQKNGFGEPLGVLEAREGNFVDPTLPAVPARFAEFVAEAARHPVVEIDMLEDFAPLKSSSDEWRPHRESRVKHSLPPPRRFGAR